MRIEIRKELEGVFNDALRLRDEGNTTDAIAVLGGLLSQYPGEIPPRLVRAEILRSIGRYEEAATDFQMITRSEVPLHSNAYRLSSQGLFHSLLALGRIQEACDEGGRYFSQPGHQHAEAYREGWLALKKLAGNNKPEDILRMLARDRRDRGNVHGAE